MELSKESNVKYETVKRWGTEKSQKPNAYDLVKVAGVLGTTAEELLKGE